MNLHQSSHDVPYSADLATVSKRCFIRNFFLPHHWYEFWTHCCHQQQESSSQTTEIHFAVTVLFVNNCVYMELPWTLNSFFQKKHYPLCNLSGMLENKNQGVSMQTIICPTSLPFWEPHKRWTTQPFKGNLSPFRWYLVHIGEPFKIS